MKKFALAPAAAFLFFAGALLAQSEILQRNDSERQLFDLLNHERVAWRLGELRWDDTLFKAARKHALLMVDQDSMEHQLPGEPNLEERLTAAGARFTLISENIAIGGSPATIHDGWMNSPGHRKNILDSRVTAVGIAVVRGRNGLFAAEDFSQAFENLTAEQQEKQMAALLASKGFRVGGTADDARKACDATPTSGARAMALIRFETGDLNDLAPEVEKKLRAEPYRNVEVGACSVSGAAGFARYRIVFVFF